MSQTRVVLIDGEPVRVKRCEDCGEDKRVTPGRDSGFYPVRHKRKDGSYRVGWGRFCKTCANRQKRERYAALSEDERRRLAREGWRRVKADPERHSTTRLQRNEWDRRRRAAWSAEEAEAHHERHRQSCRGWYARKVAEDPDYFSREKREGRRLARQAELAQAEAGRGRPRVWAEPLRRYLVAYITQTATIDAAAVARDLGIEERRVRAVLARQYDRVWVDVVDQALLNGPQPLVVDGVKVWGLDDLYPEPIREKERQR